MGPALVPGSLGLGGQLLGAGPQVNSFRFLCSNRHGSRRRNLLCGIFKLWEPLWSLKFNEKSDSTFSRKLGSNFWGRGTFSSLPPWGALFPYLTLGDFGPRDPDKNIFVWGDCPPPIWGDMNFGRFAFWPFFLETWLANFGNFKSIASTYSLLSILRFFKMWLA